MIFSNNEVWPFIRKMAYSEQYAALRVPFTHDRCCHLASQWRQCVKNMIFFVPCCLLPPIYRHTGWGLQRHLQGMWLLMSAQKKVRRLRMLPCSSFAADRTGLIICATAAMNVSMPRNPPNHVCFESSDIWMLMPNVPKIRSTSRAIFKTIFNVMVCLLDRVVKATSVMSTVILSDSGNPCRCHKFSAW